MDRSFDPHCTRCERLTAFMSAVKAEHPDYHCAPVAPFGDPEARLLIVGLAPGKHGANASGRPFTGDYAGILLYRTLHEFGFASRPESRSADDGLVLTDCRITNAVKCLPPENKPLNSEVINCNPYLQNEIERSPPGLVILALGALAHRALMRTFGLKQSAHPFAHDAQHRLPEGRMLVDSYHCSRYNTQTGRLTEPMFRKVFKRIRKLID
ncbi:MAG TPA: uracil-DNA glycosylase [Arenicellales bacterium]|nr:uracil-DNA glycosylase [Arenicellales bacterium]